LISFAESASSLRVERQDRLGEARLALEAQLERLGVALPLTARAAWLEENPAARGWLFGLRDGTGELRGGFGATVFRSRALPGHRIIRAERFGAGLAPGPLSDAAVTALVAAARGSPWALRLRVEIFTADDELRSGLGVALAAAGLHRDPHPRNYERTITVDLRPPLEALLDTVGRRARRAIKAADKFPIRIGPITDPALAPRMQALLTETLQRTGGKPEAFDAVGSIRFAGRHPRLARLVGLFHNEVDGEGSLLAFAWSHFHGDHASYETAASTRSTEAKIPLLYPLAWDLMRWAKAQGASWFDFGGVTDGSTSSEDPLGGISDFKRAFSESVVVVGEDWELELAPRRARLARLVGTVSGWLVQR
jgi:hypothetical protein